MDTKIHSVPETPHQDKKNQKMALACPDKGEVLAIPPSQLVTFDLVFQDESSPLLAAAAQKNTGNELSIPREVISSSVSSTSMVSEILRPLTAGTYKGQPAYLIQLQLQIQSSAPRQSWRRRIQAVSISIVAEDAPLCAEMPVKANRGELEGEGGDKNPAFIKTYPGPEGWEGPVATQKKNKEIGIELQGGWMGFALSFFTSKALEKEEKGRARVTTMRFGRKNRNEMRITAVENPVDAAGVPAHLIIPILLVHHNRRFSLRVIVKATFGFWRGKIAESFPVLGKADDPLYFDPEVIDHVIETGKTEFGGSNIGEWKGEISDLDLSKYSSLSVPVDSL